MQFRLADRFGDNGLVSVMIFRPADAPGVLDIDTWVMICRVFGRELENEAMSIAVEAARSRDRGSASGLHPDRAQQRGERPVAMAWVGVLFLIAVTFPNTLQLTARYEPPLGVLSKPVAPLSWLRALDWAPTVPWAVAISSLVVAAVMRLGGKSEFFYWQF